MDATRRYGWKQGDVNSPAPRMFDEQTNITQIPHRYYGSTTVGRSMQLAKASEISRDRFKQEEICCLQFSLAEKRNVLEEILFESSNSVGVLPGFYTTSSSDLHYFPSPAGDAARYPERPTNTRCSVEFEMFRRCKNQAAESAKRLTGHQAAGS